MSASLATKLAQLYGTDIVAKGVFMGRVGGGPTPAARSLRKPVGELMHAVSGDALRCGL
jgi:hypothetical protein